MDELYYDNIECPMITSRTDMKEAYLNWLKSQNILYHLTTSFTPTTGAAEAELYFNDLIRQLNRRSISRRYKSKGIHLQGFVARELSKDRALHYHTLLFNIGPRMPSAEALELNLEAIRNTINNRRKYSNSIAKDGFLLQKYHNKKGGYKLENYVLKNFYDRRLTTTDAIDSIGILGYDGAHFGSQARDISAIRNHL